jgi:hypothetical protein
LSSFDHQKLRDLKPGWDSYAAKAIDRRCIEKAFQLWRELPGTDWSAVPCADGGVQLEQHKDGLDIEIRVSPASALETGTAPCEHHWWPAKDPESQMCPKCGSTRMTDPG